MLKCVKLLVVCGLMANVGIGFAADQEDQGAVSSNCGSPVVSSRLSKGDSNGDVVSAGLFERGGKWADGIIKEHPVRAGAVAVAAVLTLTYSHSSALRDVLGGGVAKVGSWLPSLRRS